MTSYNTLDSANAYFDTRLGTVPWLDRSPSDQVKALLMATRIIDSFNYQGNKAVDTQEHEFPRGFDSAVPDSILRAEAEIALAICDGWDPDQEIKTSGMAGEGIGHVKVTYDLTASQLWVRAGLPSMTVFDLLNPYFRDSSDVILRRVS